MNAGEELSRLAALRDQGVLSSDEFEAETAKLLTVTPDVTSTEIEKKKSDFLIGCIGLIVLVAVLTMIAGAIFGGASDKGASNDPVGVSGSVAPSTKKSSTTVLPQTAKPAPHHPKYDLPGEALATWHMFQLTTEPCTTSTDAIYNDWKNADRYTIYPLLMTGQHDCGEAGAVISGLQPPDGASEAVRTKFGTALSDCGSAYSAVATAFKQMASVFDGNDRPSAVLEAKQASQAAADAKGACTMEMIEAVTSAGVSTSAI